MDNSIPFSVLKLNCIFWNLPEKFATSWPFIKPSYEDGSLVDECLINHLIAILFNV